MCNEHRLFKRTYTFVFSLFTFSFLSIFQVILISENLGLPETLYFTRNQTHECIPSTTDSRIFQQTILITPNQLFLL